MAGIFDSLSGMLSQSVSGAPEFVELAQVRDRFQDAKPLYSTRLALAYDSEDIQTRKRVVLWTLRFPIPPVSQDAVTLIRSLKQVLSIQFSGPDALTYGIDRKGIGFYSTARIPARPLMQLQERPKRPSFYFLHILRTLSKLHATGWALGSLSDDSYLVDDGGKISLNGLFVSIPGLNAGALAAASTSCIAPEVLRGGPATPASDVFAAGAYIYKLLSRKDYPFNLTQQQQYEHLRGQLPVICKSSAGHMSWFQPLLEQALAWKPESRYATATQFLEAVLQASPDTTTLSRNSTLQNIDAKAAEYLMSRETRYGVMALIMVLMSATIFRWSTPDAPLQVAAASVPAAGSVSLTTSSPKAEVTNVKQLNVISAVGGSSAGSDVAPGAKVFEHRWDEFDQRDEDRQCFIAQFRDRDQFSPIPPATGDKQPVQPGSRNVARDSQPAVKGKGKGDVKVTQERTAEAVPWWLEPDSPLSSLIRSGSIYRSPKKPRK